MKSLKQFIKDTKIFTGIEKSSFPIRATIFWKAFHYPAGLVLAGCINFALFIQDISKGNWFLIPLAFGGAIGCWWLTFVWVRVSQNAIYLNKSYGFPESTTSTQNQLIPKISSPVLGYRAWMLETSNHLLKPLYQAEKSEPGRRWVRKVYWGPGVNKAYCEYGDQCFSPEARAKENREDRAHIEKHQCGLYANHTLKQVLGDEDRTSSRNMIIGAVIGWGKSSIHDLGWRASKARILALLVPADCTKTEKKNYKILAHKYQIPLFDNQKSFLWYTEEYGKSISKQKAAELTYRQGDDK
jgi:hypothetical protein